ncbi:P-loop containing nucleoside triphosphate hydrolase protein [Cryphonectria parasitica EP155]|uniref:P-loop containing nucleoside triphosphate hydrolase protein n=1 Tax=Cryphonectria parasitica (strain ATCC 38755 / EP155) TaxID=660469 RepID=A0A9P4Y5A5_CRYP1|nr:P-loop containing nucleoside triphosphate hydrolase protein [Cryphonectria parasitica EP155]KAF3766766.1 P-loop containing nucleoside triphosphate hydrolase protein [Cryphonectria parasitica EP155]
MGDSSVGSGAGHNSSNNLFQVYLRLRPPPVVGLSSDAERFIIVDRPAADASSTAPTHITLSPPNDRRRAVEKFAFTHVFEEDATQLDVFHCTNVVPLVEGILAPHGREGTDALLATLGMTGSGKSHTMLGSRSQRGLTQLALDLLFRSIGDNIAEVNSDSALETSIKTSDASEASISSATAFIEAIYGDASGQAQPPTRAQTPQLGDHLVPLTPRRHLARPSTLPQVPDISTINVPCDPAAEYIVLMSMYEVYNDRIFDLLMPPVRSSTTKEFRRRPLLFKPTELSPDRKVVAGLRKIMCSDFHQAMMVLEAGLHERRVAGTVSNSVSSRSHGFFCIEVMKRKRSVSKRHRYPWSGNTLTIVDLAGSERARDAKTAGATLAEAGKINESLMYLGQCLQMQSDIGSNSKPSIVPFRQCKLTELLFSNSFPSSSSLSQSQMTRRNPQKAVMIVTADASGDYNATSQILRYSALAREVTIPRNPSISEAMLQVDNTAEGPSTYDSGGPVLSPAWGLHRPPCLLSSTTTQGHTVARDFSPTSMTSSEDRVTMEHAALEISRLSEETRHLRESLLREQEARAAAETHLLSIQDKMLELEQAVREDCVAEFEQRLAVELARWKAGMQMAIERGEEHWDRKMAVFERGLADHPAEPEAVGSVDMDACDNKENILTESLEEENARLRREVMILKRELAGKSPTKRMPLMERDDFTTSANGSPLSMYTRQGNRSENSSRGNSNSRVEGTGTPTKRLRKLTTRKWEGGLGVEDDPF